MNTIVSLLMMVISGHIQNSVERNIAIEILASLNTLSSLTLSSLATRAQTSTASINKFCRELGFRNFAEFKVGLITTSEIRNTQMKHRYHNMDVSEIKKMMTIASNRTIDWQRFVQEATVINEKIAKAKRVVYIGAVYPVMLSLHYEEDMNMMGVFMYPQQIGKKLELPVVEEDTLFLIVSLTGRITNYHSDEFEEAVKKQKNIVMIGNAPKTSAYIANSLYLPSDGDDENGNELLLQALRYLEYTYYKENYPNVRR